MSDYNSVLNTYFNNLQKEVEEYKNNPYNYKYSQSECYKNGFSEFCNMIQNKYSGHFKINKLYETMSGNSKKVDPYICLKYYDNKIKDGIYIYIKFPSQPDEKWLKISLELGRTGRYNGNGDKYITNLNKLYNMFEYNIEAYKSKMVYCSNLTSLGDNNNLLEGYIYDFTKLDEALDLFEGLYITIISRLEITDWNENWEKVQKEVFNESYVAPSYISTDVLYDNNDEALNIDKEKFEELKTNYLNDFDNYIPDEIYKWEAIKVFNDNWDLNVPNEEFANMVEKSLKESDNILMANRYYPYSTLLTFSRKEPETVRKMFEVLFDETEDLYNRINNFVNKSDELLDKYLEEGKSHYQDMHVISVYLGFKYPNKYYLFKSQANKNVLKYLGIDISDSDKIKELINYFNICNEIHKLIIKDDRITEKLDSSLNDKCYKMDNYHILTWDFLYYSGRVYLRRKMEEESIADDSNNENLVEGEKNINPIEEINANNIIYYGGPGCGKSKYVENTYCRNDNYIRTTFYPDYTNSDFVGQLVPKYNKEVDKLEYTINPGPFTRAIEMASHNQNRNIYLIIEEINRGNAAAIFGDIFQLLDRNEKSEEPGKIIGESVYDIENNIIKEYLGIKKVKIPFNLSIIATMNTSDQNVYTLDSAFKRRWKMVYINNDFNNNEPYDNRIRDKYVPMKGCNITWENFKNVINDCIVNINTYGIHSEDKQIGKYFVGEFDLLDKKIDEYEDPSKAIKKFSEKVLMYIWEDIAKLDKKRWFNDDIKTFNRLLKEYDNKGIEVFSLEIQEALKEQENRISKVENKEETKLVAGESSNNE